MRRIGCASCNGFSATTIWMVEQLGFETMLRAEKPASASRFTSGTTRGTSLSRRKVELLSITTQPAAAARGACTLETAPPGENSAMSQPEKSNSSSTCTSSSSSPKDTLRPWDLREASAAMSSTGKDVSCNPSRSW